MDLLFSEVKVSVYAYGILTTELKMAPPDLVATQVNYNIIELAD